MDVSLQITERFDALPEIGADAIERMLDLVSQEFWGGVREEAPVDTGRLAGSFLLEKRDSLTYAVMTNVEYALAVHDGTQPHVIEPVSAGALYWPGAAHPVRRVHHPGTAGNPFAERAMTRTESRMAEFAELAVTAAMEAGGL